ncbi:MAG: YdcF family protein [Actinomycetota bacterium]
MALLISKTLTELAYPLSLSLLLTLLGAVFVWRGQKRPAGLSLLCSLLVLWVPSTPAVSDYLRASLERRHLPMALEKVPKADAIVVLGGVVGAALPPRLTVDLSGASDRVLYAAQLYQAGKGRLVIASGGALPWQCKSPAEAYAMAALLTEWGVPHGAIMLETASRNTYENAVNSKRLLGAHGLHQVLLVTSALHMPRALALFRALGIEAAPAPTDFEVVESGDETLLQWLPDADALEGSTRALKEYFGLGVYWVRGWL